jgi:hypothetical protein
MTERIPDAELLSESIERLLQERRDRVKIADILELLGERAFGAGILLFALPNLIPLPPGSSAVLGAPLLFITAQLMIGRKAMWLPKRITEKTVSWDSIKRGLGKVVKWLRRAERVMRPRLSILCTPTAERLVGVACLMMTIILFLPIPFANFLPALALVLFALGLAAQDGVVVALGWAVTAATIVVARLVVYGVVEGSTLIIKSVLGL